MLIHEKVHLSASKKKLLKIIKTYFYFFLNNRSISSPIHSVLVNDGNICSELSFCQNNTCIQQKSKQSCDLQKTCSGNGVKN
jgi:hypothetical protein